MADKKKFTSLPIRINVDNLTPPPFEKDETPKKEDYEEELATINQKAKDFLADTRLERKTRNEKEKDKEKDDKKEKKVVKEVKKVTQPAESVPKQLKRVVMRELKDEMTQSNELKLDGLEKSATLTTAEVLDFSGLESATDLMFCLISKSIAKNKVGTRAGPNQIVDTMMLCGCRYISAWTLQYINESIGRTSLYPSEEFNAKLRERTAGCRGISDSMIVSLQYQNTDKYEKEPKLIDSAKVVVINEDGTRLPSLVHLLTNSGDTIDAMFQYGRLESQGKMINLFQCSESIADMFLSERNLVILTYNTQETTEVVKTSIVRRILKVITKNIIPERILVLGIGSGDNDPKQSAALQTSIVADLKALQLELSKSVTKQTTDLTKLTFQAQLRLSVQLNVSEDLEIIEHRLSFMTLSGNTADPQLQNGGATPSIEMLSAAKAVHAAVDDVKMLKKSDIVEAKAYKYPPTAVSTVAEAICIVFAKKPEYKNFLAMTPTIVEDIIKFDINSLSEFALAKLEPYMSTSEDSVRSVSLMSFKLFRWVKAVYAFSKLRQVVSDSPFITFLAKHIFCMFAWPMYYPSGEEHTQPVAITQTVLSIKLPPLQRTDEYISSLEADPQLKSLLLSRYTSFPEKFAQCQHAKGNALFVEGSEVKWVINDPQWLMKVIAKFALGETESRNHSIKQVIGKDVAIWRHTQLVEELRRFSDHPEQVIEFLVDNNLAAQVPSFVIPLCALSDDIDKTQLHDEWPKKWNGAELRAEWNLYSPLPYSAFAELINIYLNVDKTLLLWRHGILQRDGTCLVLLRYSSNKLRLCVRIADPFNIVSDPDELRSKHLTYARFIFLEYYLFVLEMLRKYTVVHELKPNEKHPSIKLFKTITETKSEAANFEFCNVEVPQNDLVYFRELFSYEHYFEQNDDSSRCLCCIDCGLTLTNYERAIRAYANLFPDFKSFFVSSNTGMSVTLAPSSDDQETSSFEARSWYLRGILCNAASRLSGCEVRFIDSNYEQTNVKLQLNVLHELEDMDGRFETVEQPDGGSMENMEWRNRDNYISVNINDRIVQTVFKSEDLQSKVEIKMNKLQMALNQDVSVETDRYKIYTNDVIRVTTKITSACSSELSVYYNDDRLLVIEVKDRRSLFVVPEFIEQSEPSSTPRYILTATSGQQTEEVEFDDAESDDFFFDDEDIKEEIEKRAVKTEDTQEDAEIALFREKVLLKRLEARDRRTPQLCAVATIVDVRANHEVLILTFDGWGRSYDYWASINDEDFFPCGFIESWMRRKHVPFKGMSKLEPPIGWHYDFHWQTYLEKCDAKALPWNFFSPNQLHGMTQADFCDSRYAYRHEIKCKYGKNPRAKQRDLTNYFDNYRNGVFKMLTGDLYFRGLAVLPNSINMEGRVCATHELNAKGAQVHMVCLNDIRFQGVTPDEPDPPKIHNDYLYAHMLDVKGLTVPADILVMQDLMYFVATAYFLASADNPLIVTSCREMLSGHSTDDVSTLSERLRSFFRDFFATYCLYIKQLLFRDTTIDLAKYETCIGEEVKERVEYSIVTSRKSSYLSLCHFCANCASVRFEGETVPVLTKPFNSLGTSVAALRCRVGTPNTTKHLLQVDDDMTRSFNHLRMIDLSDVSVECLGAGFEAFSQLAYLKLNNNKLRHLPASVLEIKSLLSLTVNMNPMHKLADSSVKRRDTFMNLPNLVILQVANLFAGSKHTPSDTDLIVLPNKLSKLNVTNLAINTLPFDFTACRDEIIEVTLSGVRWLDDYHLTSSGMEAFNEFFQNVLNESEIKTLFTQCLQTGEQTLDKTGTLKINAHIFKRFARLTEIPHAIFTLTNLTKLDLSYQAIITVPDEISLLKNLRMLKVTGCVLLKTLSAQLGKLKLVELYLENCLSLETPPPEIVKRGHATIMKYLQQLSLGEVVCMRSKLMLVGLGEAGKTSLLNAMTRDKQKPDEEIQQAPTVTDGINIKEWYVDIKDQETRLVFSMWDFAGQSVYYNTHQFFLSAKAVYLVVWNVRMGSEYAGLDFWLSSIVCHAPDAPIFIVGTHIDEVSKYSIDMHDLQSRYKQIVGFYFVSSPKQIGIAELKDKIIEVALHKTSQKKIPAVWLKFEQKIKSHDQPLVSYREISVLAEASGIFEEEAVHQAVLFLNDLGSLQYFDIKTLKDNVVIDPQWIVDVMACVVSVKETCIHNGRLLHKDIHEIWKQYDESLHEWMLRLTEEFDLTFPVPDSNMNIVPCLLPEKQPDEFKWFEIDPDSPIKIKEIKVVYKFGYLPYGLFNRIQVRLFKYGDGNVIWRTGSLLHKNNHRALVTQDMKNLSICVLVQGIKPENLIFVIHEVIESLIFDSFRGIHYDYSFPCPACIDVTMSPSHAHMFTSSVLKRACHLKAPFLQCQEFFHVVSIPEMLAVMPVEGANNLDLNLEYSIRDLKELKRHLKYDVAFWYCENDVPKSDADEAVMCDPRKLLDVIRKETNYKVWSSKNVIEQKIDALFGAIKEAKLVVLCVSDNFASDEKCVQVFEFVTNIVRKAYLLVEFGKLNTHEWMKQGTFASVVTDYRVIIQDPKRFAVKCVETLEALERQLKDTKTQEHLDGSDASPEIFISYCWSNSAQAVQKGTKKTNTSLGWLDPRQLAKLFRDNGMTVWIDIQEASTSQGLFSEITKGMNAASVVVACLSDEYAASKNCLLEFRFAHCSLKIPIVKAIVGTGNEWKKHEVSFLSNDYPEINFQYENKAGFEILLGLVKERVEKARESKKTAQISDKKAKKEMAAANNVAYAELYELTQRKYLKQLVLISDKMPMRQSPRLFCIELVTETATEDEETSHHGNQVDETSLEPAPQEGLISNITNSSAIAKSLTKATASLRKEVNLNSLNSRRSRITSRLLRKNSQDKTVSVTYCLKAMCECETGWHADNVFVSLPHDDQFTRFCPYLARTMNILRHGTTATTLAIFASKEGSGKLSEIDRHADATNDESDFANSYTELRKYYVNEIRKSEFTDKLSDEESMLKLYELPNGKVLWLCSKHATEVDGNEKNDAVDFTTTEDNNKVTMLDELIKMSIPPITETKN